MSQFNACVCVYERGICDGPIICNVVKVVMFVANALHTFKNKLTIVNKKLQIKNMQLFLFPIVSITRQRIFL